MYIKYRIILFCLFTVCITKVSLAQKAIPPINLDTTAQSLPIHKVWNSIHRLDHQPNQHLYSTVIKRLKKSLNHLSFWEQWASYTTLKQIETWSWPQTINKIKEFTHKWLHTHQMKIRTQDVSQHWLWLRYENALYNRREKEATFLSQKLGFLRHSYFSDRLIDAKQSLEVQDWKKNPSLFDRSALIDAHVTSHTAGIYFVWHLHSPQEQVLHFHLTHSRAVKAWLNTDILTQLKRPNGFKLDQNTWTVHVRKGYNRFMIHLQDTDARCLLRISTIHKRILRDQDLQTHKAQWGNWPEAVEALDPPMLLSHWQEEMNLLNQHPQRFSDYALLGMAKYAQYYQLIDQDRVWLSIEVDRRWQKSPNWTLAEALVALTPTRLRRQIWRTYDISSIPISSKEDLMHYSTLLIQRANDAMIDDRLDQVAHYLAQLLHNKLDRIDILLLWTEWLNMLDLTQVSLKLLSKMHDKWPHHQKIRLLYIHTLWQQGLGNQAICDFQMWLQSLTNKQRDIVIDESMIILWRAIYETLPYDFIKNTYDIDTLYYKCRSGIYTTNQQLTAQLTRGAFGFPYALADLERAVEQGDPLIVRTALAKISLPQHPQVLRLKAIWAYKQGNLVKAQKFLKLVLKHNPQSNLAEYLNNLKISKKTIILGTKISKILQSASPSTVPSASLSTSPSTSFTNASSNTLKTLTHHHQTYSKQNTISHYIKAKKTGILEKNISINFDQQGRLIRRQRSLIRIGNPKDFKQWQSLHVLYQPEHQNLHLDAFYLYRKTAHSWIKIMPQSINEISISQDEFRLYYDVQKKQITFEPLQPGDLIEWAWTLTQKNNDLQKIMPYAEMIPLQSKEFIHHLNLYLGDQAKQRLHTHLVRPNHLTQSWLTPLSSAKVTESLSQESLMLCSKSKKQKTKSSCYKTKWSWQDIPPISIEPYSWKGSSLTPYVYFSTFKDWKSVRDLYFAILQPALHVSEDLKNIALQWTQGIKGEAEQIQALYQKITERIRYVGLEFGQHSFQPAMPAQTLIRGFGDCKDRAVLLIVLARALGIKLQFVMVRTADIGRLDPKGVAGVNAFNHALVYSPSLDRFLDPTVSHHDVWTLPSADQGAHILRIPSQLIAQISSKKESLNPQRESPILSIIPYSSADQEGIEHTIDISQWPMISLKLTYTGIWAVHLRQYIESGYLKTWFHKKFTNLNLDQVELSYEGHKPVKDPIIIYVKAKSNQEDWQLFIEEDWQFKHVRMYTTLDQRISTLRVLPYAQKNCIIHHKAQLHLVSKWIQKSKWGSVTLHHEIVDKSIPQRWRSCLDFKLKGQDIPPTSYPLFKSWIQTIQSEWQYVLLTVFRP
jgi:hypothetical protein